MKKIPALLILILFWITACKSLETNTYRTIGATVVTVDGAMKAWRDYVHAGKATQAQQDKVKALYINYQEYMDFAERAVAEYRKNPNATGTQKAVSAASAAAGDLINWLAGYLPELKKGK